MEINNTKNYNIRIFVFGTLRKGERLEFYMDDDNYKGLHYTRGQLMKAENGSVYIDFSNPKAITIGELYEVNFACLQRINHLEAVSGEFPKGYDLAVLPVWKLDKDKGYVFSQKSKTDAFFYQRRNRPFRIINGDYTTDFEPIKTIGCFLKNTNDKNINSKEILSFYKEKLKNINF